MDRAQGVALAARITAAWIANPHNQGAGAAEATGILATVTNALTRLDAVETIEDEPEYVPATTVRKSLASPDHIISMIDGQPYRSLRAHLKAHGLTPAEYRARYGLKPDYPMVAKAYSEMRRMLAKRIGLGRKPSPAAQTPKPAHRRKLSIAKR